MSLRVVLLSASFAANAWCAPEPATAPTPPAAVEIDETVARVWALNQPRLADDVDGFEAFILSKMRARGVKVTHLSPESLRKLRTLLTQTSETSPTEFHFFAASARGLSEEEVTGVFVSLQGGHEEFSQFVRSRVRFVTTFATDPAATEGDKKLAAAAHARYDFVEKHMQVPWDAWQKVLDRVSGVLGGGGGAKFDGAKRDGADQEGTAVSATGGFHPVGAAN